MNSNTVRPIQMVPKPRAQSQDGRIIEFPRQGKPVTSEKSILKGNILRPSRKVTGVPFSLNGNGHVNRLQESIAARHLSEEGKRHIPRKMTEQSLAALCILIEFITVLLLLLYTFLGMGLKPMILAIHSLVSAIK